MLRMTAAYSDTNTSETWATKRREAGWCVKGFKGSITSCMLNRAWVSNIIQLPMVR